MGLCCCKERKNFEDQPMLPESPRLPRTSTDNIPMENLSEPSCKPAESIKSRESSKRMVIETFSDLKPINIVNNINVENVDNNKEEVINVNNEVLFDEDLLPPKNEEVIQFMQPVEKPVKNKPCLCFFDQIKQYFHLRVYIEHLEVFHKQCDDFGLVFKPYIELLISDQQPNKITIIDEEKLNNSGLTDDQSFNTSVTESTQLKSFVSFVDNPSQTGMKQGKVYTYKTSKNYQLTKDAFYNHLTIKVNNETSFNANLNTITVGDAKIPINLIADKMNDHSFDGVFEIRLRNTSFVGYLKVVISVSHKSFDGHEELMRKISNKKLLSDLEFDENPLNMFSKSNEVWSKNLLHFAELNPDVVDNYFIFEYESREFQLEAARKFLARVYEKHHDDNMSLNEKNSNLSKNVEGAYLYKTLNECLFNDNENFVLLYELFVCLNILCINNEFNIINDFFKMFSDEERGDFYSLPEFTDYNVHFIKVYLMFVYHYQKYIKNNKSVTIRNNKFIDDINLLDCIAMILKKIGERAGMNKSVVNEEYQIEMRECLIWCTNNIIETISQPLDILLPKFNQSDSSFERRKDFTTVYDNCLHLVSKRIYLLKVMENFIEDSQIVSGIIRVLRKMIQILTTDSNSLLDKSKEPKVFAKEFRKLLISQNEAFFILSLRAILGKYYHYPEIHNNILIILFQITTYLDTANLALTAEKLYLEEFKEAFDPFRGRLRIFCKFLNNLHLNVLANLSDVVKSNPDPEYEPIIKNIMFDLKAFYRNTPNAKKRLEDFKSRKLSEVDIHETITRIGVNITKYQKLSYSLIDSYFYDDIIEYLIVIAKTNDNKKDFIQQIADKKKKDPDDVKRYVLSIVENSQMILINIINSEDEEISEIVCNQILNEHEIEDATHLKLLLEECKVVLINHGCSVTKVEQNMKILEDLFEIE